MGETTQHARAALKALATRADDVVEGAMYPDSDPHSQHRVDLPGENEFDLTYREGPHAPERPPAPDRLHVCFHCAGEFVYPLDWSEEGSRHWRIILRCPDCESTREGVFEQTTVECLEDELDRATGELLGDLKLITHANMTEEMEFFIRALDADLIVPSDF
jgi:hypothetical protein